MASPSTSCSSQDVDIEILNSHPSAKWRDLKTGISSLPDTVVNTRTEISDGFNRNFNERFGTGNWTAEVINITDENLPNSSPRSKSSRYK